MATAAVIGSGPNGVTASIVLASAGYDTTVFERNKGIGGACATAETTLPGYRQDLGSSVYPLCKASPFFSSLPIDIPWIRPDVSCAHRSMMVPPFFWNIRLMRLWSTLMPAIEETTDPSSSL
jgi:phytoene dehydrogenase-like protein